MLQVDDAALADTEWLKQAIVAVRNIRAEMNIAPGKPLELLLRGCSKEAERRVNDNRSFLLNPRVWKALPCCLPMIKVRSR